MTVEKIIDEIVKLCGICLDFSPDTPKKYNVVDFVYDYDKQLEKIKKIIKKLVENQKEEIHKPKKPKIKKYDIQKLNIEKLTTRFKDLKFKTVKIDPNDPEVKKLIEETKKEIEKTRNLQKIDPNIGNLFVG